MKHKRYCVNTNLIIFMLLFYLECRNPVCRRLPSRYDAHIEFKLSKIDNRWNHYIFRPCFSHPLPFYDCKLNNAYRDTS